jgi:hypothetical protein
MLGADLVAAAQRRIEAAHGCRTPSDRRSAVAQGGQLLLLQALTYLATGWWTSTR